MRTAVDTNILSAVWRPESNARELAEALSQWRAVGSLVVSGAVYAEALASPHSDEAFVFKFFDETELTVDYEMGKDAWQLAGTRYRQYAERRRKSERPLEKRLLADFIIGSHAVLHADQLMTMDRRRYERDFPELKLV
jgi:predicted nucleic acid-binding protein